MKFVVLAVGKLRDAWVREGCEEYLRRIRAKLAIELLEVKSSDDLERKLPERALVWALDVGGKQLTSEELAAAVKLRFDRSAHAIAFVIGGTDGLPDALVQRADLRWSLGKLTLPHRLARLVLVEQLYRALSILHGEPYHRG